MTTMPVLRAFLHPTNSRWFQLTAEQATTLLYELSRFQIGRSPMDGSHFEIFTFTTQRISPIFLKLRRRECVCVCVHGYVGALSSGQDETDFNCFWLEGALHSQFRLGMNWGKQGGWKCRIMTQYRVIRVQLQQRRLHKHSSLPRNTTHWHIHTFSSYYLWSANNEQLSTKTQNRMHFKQKNKKYMSTSSMTFCTL